MPGLLERENTTKILFMVWDGMERFVGLDSPLIRSGELESWIVYEDDAVIALNKPGWLVCHPSKNGPQSSLAGAVKVYLEASRMHLVSRLDRETSGIVIIAKTRHAASQYQRAIEARRCRKTYLVWLCGCLNEAIEVDQPLARDLESAVYVKQTVRSSNSAQNAITRFYPLHYDVTMDLTIAKVDLVTGRKHQIRAHALWFQKPVFGDKIYGPDDNCYLEFIEKGWTPELESKLKFPRQALHALSLEFESVPYQSRFVAPLTGDLRQLCGCMGVDPDAALTASDMPHLIS